MSFVSVVPDIISAAAGNLESIGSALTEANGAAAIPTFGLGVMGADEISAAVKAAFVTHAQQYQAVSAQAAAFHEEFVRTLSTGVGAYVSTELANAEQNVLNAVNAPVQSLLGAAGPAPAAAVVNEMSQSFNYPLGPLQLSGNIAGSVLDDGSVFVSGGASATLGPVSLLSASGTASLPVNGPVFVGINGNSLYGPVGLTLSGTSAPVGDVPTIQFTSGTLNLPSAIPLLAAQYGPYVVGAASLGNSSGALMSALSSGNVLGAATAFLGSPLNFSEAMLYGTTTVSFPDTTIAAALGLPVSSLPQVHIPFGGYLAPPQPITVTVPTISYGSEGTLLGSQFALQGTTFGGIVPLLLNSIGIQT